MSPIQLFVLALRVLCWGAAVLLPPTQVMAAALPVVPAFPGAEGAGALTPGGRGGRVLAVTNLADDGPGSFRNAVEAAGPRVIVFRVSGIIDLRSDIVVRNSRLTIAGQSAPGDGICLRGRSLRIEGAEDIEVHFYSSQQASVTARATLIGSDPSTDLALLKVDSGMLPPPVPIGSSDSVRVGDSVLTIGYPRRDLMTQKSVSSGIVSALGIPRDGLPIVEYIQTDAAMNYGNSGGALINTRGELIGINSFIYSETGNSDGIGFAVPVNKAMIVVEQLIARGEVTPGYLGVITGEMLNAESSASFFGTPDIDGLLIEQVNEGSPAEIAGVRAGDVMAAIDNQDISSVISAIEQINRKAPGESVDLRIFRSGSYQTISVVLGTGTAQYRTQSQED